MARRPSAVPAPLRIGLYGGWGTGNWGNDETARTFVDQLSRTMPEAVPVLVSYGTPPDERPAGTAPVVWLGASRPGSGSPVARVVHRLVGAAGDLGRHVRVARSVDVLLVAGGGLFENDATASSSSLGGFLNLLGSALATRAGRRPFGIVAVGATPWEGGAAGRLVERLMRLATYRSFRDARSRGAMVQDGGARADDPVHADVVFAADAADPPAPGTCVGLGVMAHGWLGVPRTADARDHATSPYVQACVDLALTMRSRGVDVLVFGGDDADTPWAAEVVRRVGQEGGPGPGGVVELVDVSVPGALDGAVRRCGVVVCSRYHNVITAFRLGRPVVALADRVKTRTIMESAGQSAFVVEAREADAEALEALVARLLDESGDVARAEIREATSRMSVAAREQFAELAVVLSQRVPAPDDAVAR